MVRSSHRLAEKRRPRGWLTTALAMSLAAMALPGLICAQPPTVEGGDAAPIRISADRLVARAEDNTADFIGNVRAVQGNTIIEADRMTIRYADAAGQSAPGDAPAAIDEIASSGNVTIRFDNKVARAAKALYNTHTQVLVLSGSGTRVTSGNNSVSGERITVYRREDRITVEGAENKRVEAVIYSGQQGLSVPGTPAPDAAAAE